MPSAAERKLEDVQRTMRLVRSVQALAILVLRERALMRERARLRLEAQDDLAARDFPGR